MRIGALSDQLIPFQLCNVFFWRSQIRLLWQIVLFFVIFDFILRWNSNTVDGTLRGQKLFGKSPFWPLKGPQKLFSKSPFWPLKGWPLKVPSTVIPDKFLRISSRNRGSWPGLNLISTINRDFYQSHFYNLYFFCNSLSTMLPHGIFPFQLFYLEERKDFSDLIDIKPWPWVFDEKSFYLILNMAVGGTLGGEVVPEDLPATVEFDWIRVYAEGCKAGLLSP